MDRQLNIAERDRLVEELRARTNEEIQKRDAERAATPEVSAFISKMAEGMAKLPWKGWDDIVVTEDDLRRSGEDLERAVNISRVGELLEIDLLVAPSVLNTHFRSQRHQYAWALIETLRALGEQRPELLRTTNAAEAMIRISLVPA